jgi:hypothetical protein
MRNKTTKERKMQPSTFNFSPQTNNCHLSMLPNDMKVALINYIPPVGNYSSTQGTLELLWGFPKEVHRAVTDKSMEASALHFKAISDFDRKNPNLIPGVSPSYVAPRIQDPNEALLETLRLKALI